MTKNEPFSNSLILHGIVKINELSGNYKMSQSMICFVYICLDLVENFLLNSFIKKAG